MIKTLKITSIVVPVLAAAFVVFLAVYGLRKNELIEKFLASPGAAEKFKNLASKSEKTQDAISPLIKQAQNFALRIDPPPPPKPPEPKEPKEVAKKPEPKTKPKPTPKKTNISSKVSLLATCRYENAPDRSLAMLKTVAEGNKWFRQGEQVGHLTIHEIKDGSVVLYKDGRKNSEISVPVQNTTKSLLKSDSANISPKRQTSITVPDLAPGEADIQPAAPGIPSPTRPQTSPRIPGSKRSPASQKRTSTTQLRRPTTLKPESTPAQRKQQIDDDIASIKNLMSRPSAAPTEEEKQKEKENWEKLIKTLQKQRQEIDKKTKNKESDQAPEKQ
jgi:hypothetical protein